jgi:hypothetical protein
MKLEGPGDKSCADSSCVVKNETIKKTPLTPVSFFHAPSSFGLKALVLLIS